MLKHFFVFILLIVTLTQCDDATEKNRRDLSKVAEAINEKCPRILDSETRLDGIEVKEPNTLIYKYTLMNILSQKVDTVQFYRALWPGIISNIKVSGEMKKLREANTFIDYYYQDKVNKPIYTFHISPADYH